MAGFFEDSVCLQTLGCRRNADERGVNGGANKVSGVGFSRPKAIDASGGGIIKGICRIDCDRGFVIVLNIIFRLKSSPLFLGNSTP